MAIMEKKKKQDFSHASDVTLPEAFLQRYIELETLSHKNFNL